MQVELNEAEQRLARFLARMRYEANRSRGVSNARVGPQDDELTDLEGIGAELAFCKLHNIYPDMSTDHHPDADALLHNGLTVDVKATRHENGHLLAVRWKRKAVDVFVLLVGKFPAYRCAGFMPAAELLTKERLRDFGYGPSYAASQSELGAIR